MEPSPGHVDQRTLREDLPGELEADRIERFPLEACGLKASLGADRIGALATDSRDMFCQPEDWSLRKASSGGGLGWLSGFEEVPDCWENST